MQADEISPNNDVSGEAAVASRSYVIILGQRPAWNLEGILLVRAKWRDQMRQHEVDALGEIDMTPTQIKCAEILLRKTLPDLSQIQAQVAARLVAVDRAAGRIDHG